MKPSPIMAPASLASLRDVIAVGSPHAPTSARDPLLVALLNTLACALLILDQTQRIHFANAAAERALAAGDLIGRGDDLLTTAPADRLRLSQIIAAATFRASLPGEMRSSLLLTNGNGVARIAYVRALPVADTGPCARRLPLILLAMPVAGDIDHAHTGPFALAYGLTRTEERVLVHLANGATLKAAAAQLQVATATVTTHVKHIFDKTGMRRQSDLICLFLRSLPPLAC